MVFSVNLTTEKETENIIFLIQKIKFAEQYKGSEELAQSHRRQKQNVMCEILKNCGLDVTENYDVILGMFNPTKKLLENTQSFKTSTRKKCSIEIKPFLTELNNKTFEAGEISAKECSNE